MEKMNGIVLAEVFLEPKFVITDLKITIANTIILTWL